MYIRRKCYSSLYDDLYNDYLYDKYFSEDDDYSKKGAAIGAGVGTAGGLIAAGIAGYQYNKLKNILKKDLNDIKLEKNEEDFVNKFSKDLSEIDKNAIQDYKYNRSNKQLADLLIDIKNKEKIIKDYENDVSGFAAKKIMKNKFLKGAGIIGAGMLGLTGAGYGIGKLKKKDK